MKKLYFYETGLGKIGIAEKNGAVCDIIFPGENISGEVIFEETALICEANRQLLEYLAGSRREFSLPLEPEGTTFMKSVWRQLQNIPYGKTRSYKEVAASLGNIRACRAVGQANHRNPIPIMIPCHRVISADGGLGGYGGGLDIKRLLLELENKNFCR